MVSLKDLLKMSPSRPFAKLFKKFHNPKQIKEDKKKHRSLSHFNMRGKIHFKRAKLLNNSEKLHLDIISMEIMELDFKGRGVTYKKSSL